MLFERLLSFLQHANSLVPEVLYINCVALPDDGTQQFKPLLVVLLGNGHSEEVGEVAVFAGPEVEEVAGDAPHLFLTVETPLNRRVQVCLLLTQLQNQQCLKVYHVPRLIGQKSVLCEISSLRQSGNDWAVECGGAREVFHVDQAAENAETDEEGLLFEFRLVLFVVVFGEQHEDELVVAVCHELLRPRLPLLSAAGAQLVLDGYELVVYLKL